MQKAPEPHGLRAPLKPLRTSIFKFLRHKKTPALVGPGLKSFAWYTQQVRLDLLITPRYTSKVLARPKRQESLKVDTFHKLRSIQHLSPLPPNLYQVLPQGAETQ